MHFWGSNRLNNTQLIVYARVYSLCLQYLGCITLLGKAAKQQNDNVIASTKKSQYPRKKRFLAKNSGKKRPKEGQRTLLFWHLTNIHSKHTRNKEQKKRVVNLIRSFTSQTNFFSCKYCVSICFNPPCFLLENKIKVDLFTIIVYHILKNLSKHKL